MSPFSCPREREVTELLDRGCWPDACPDDLRTHVESCRICSDLVVVSRAFQAAHRQTTPLPHLESAGALWWRAQLRRRNAAIEKVGRPILGAQIFALVISVAVGVGVLVLAGKHPDGLAAGSAADAASGCVGAGGAIAAGWDGVDRPSGTRDCRAA